MKQLKKLLCISVSSMLLLSIAPVMASDYEEHWSKDAIETLLQERIISGDTDGNMHPDAPITRAEFVKVANRTFAFTKEAEDNFADIIESSWYAREFKIAKYQGYLTGDQNQNANPEMPITRAEVSVILTKILNLERFSYTLPFTDAIPEWAKEYVGAMTASSYLAGYPDGSFRADASIARGEAFTVIARILNTQNATQNQNGNISSIPSTSHSHTGGSGGSGGGNTSNRLTSPLIPKYDKDTNTIYFTKVLGASGYVIKLVSPERTREYPIVFTQENAQNLKSEIQPHLDAFYLESDYPKFDCDIYLKAVSGNKESDYGKAVTLQISLPALPAPEIERYDETVGSDINAVVVWSNVEKAASYQVTLKVNGAENKSFLLKEAERTLIIPGFQNLKGKSVSLTIRAISQDPLLKSSISTPVDLSVLKLSGEGTAEKPYLIRTKADFLLIQENPAAHYCLLNDINLETYIPIPTFSGTLRTVSKDIWVAVTADIQGNSNNVGLFGEVNGDGIVENIIVKGNISGSQNVGGIAGKLSGNAALSNCINHARVSGERNVGGIAGYTDAASVSMDQCYNFGTISSTSSNVGGIGGYFNHFVMTKCGNYGDITGASNVGGIVGAAYCGVSESFNVGSVNSAGSAGGISGTLQKGWNIENCYNLGAVATSAKTAAGGINGTLTNLATAPNNSKIQYCYNAGAITGTNAYQISLMGTTLEWENCYYVSNVSLPNSFGTNVSSSDFTDPQNVNTAALLEENNPSAHFEMNDLDENIYPSIIGNPQNAATAKIQYHLQNLSAIKTERDVIEEGVTKKAYDMKFHWQNSKSVLEPVSYKVIDKENYQIIEQGTLDANASEFVLQNVASNKYYEFVVNSTINAQEYIAGKILADTIAPNPIMNLSAAVDQQTITVTFELPEEADYAGAALYLDNMLIKILAPDEQRILLSELKSEKTYAIKVIAFDKFGNNSAEKTVMATTQRKDYYGEWIESTDLESPGITIVEIAD